MGGRGSAGGNAKSSAVSKATGMNKAERIKAAEREIESGSMTPVSELSRKYNLSSEEAGQLVYNYTTRGQEKAQREREVAKGAQERSAIRRNLSKPITEKTSARKIDSLASNLASNANSTIVGTRGNTTYVVEAEKIRTTYTRPNGVRVPASRTVYTVTSFVKGRNSADTQTLRTEEDLRSYMKSTAATWKSRKNRLSNKQKDRLF